nr:GFA family protein [Ruegeria sp. EL01]
MVCPKPPYVGACLCGAVRVKVTASPLLTLVCHCRDCHKFSASAYSLTTMFPSDSFSYTGEVIKGGLHSNERAHYFCASCLNFIYSRIEGADWRVNLRTSVLDQAASFEPFVELMTDEKMPWVDVSVVHSFSQFPQSLDDLQTLLDGYAKWWQRSGAADDS